WAPIWRSSLPSATTATNSWPWLFISGLLLGASFTLFYYFNEYSAVSRTLSAAVDSGSSTSVHAGEGKPHRDLSGKCDLFNGEWIPNPFGAAYTNSCRFIANTQNCITNGRSNTSYTNWRWKPQDCDVPLFDPDKFLSAMRNKVWALVGDSIFRNFAESFICILSKAEEPVEVYHDERYEFKVWRFPSYNFTVSLIWSPFVSKAEMYNHDISEMHSVFLLHTDVLDAKWADQYSTFDYVVVGGGGHWYLRNSTFFYLEKNTIVGCHYCDTRSFPEMGVDAVYRKMLNSVFRFVAGSAHTPVVIFATWSPDHYENGEWNTRGTCNRATPYRRGEYDGKEVGRAMRRIELEEFERAALLGQGSARLKLFDIYRLMVLRPDAQPDRYWGGAQQVGRRKRQWPVYDCLHWWLPGAVDAWSDLIMELVLNE
ncbi:unnamed protein product, partial [Musa textilis]